MLTLIKRVYGLVFFQIKRKLRYRKLDSDYWVSMKNKYKGKRGFVIGNGPSLLAGDLEMLQDEITIASNKIYLIFPETSWRPTIYTVADRLLWPKIESKVQKIFKVIHLPNYLPVSNMSNIRYWNSPFSKFKKIFSTNLVHGAYGGDTVTYENLQIAAHLGLNPIYLIGCDHNYQGEKNSRPGIVISQGPGQTHFSKNYRKEGESVLPAAIKQMEESYTIANESTRKRGVNIFNATRGGKLEIFDRVGFDSIDF